MNKFYNLVFFLLLSSIIGCSPDLSDADKLLIYKSHVNKGRLLYSTEKYQDAIIQSDLAIEITDTLSDAFIVRGRANYNLHLFELAKKDFDEVIDIEGNKSEVFIDRALVFLQNNDSDFLKDINQHLVNSPNDENARKLKIEYCEKNNNYNDAIEEYDILISKDLNNIDLYKRRSDLSFENGNLEDALKDYNYILKLSPESTDYVLRKQNLESIITYNESRNNLIYIFICFYLLYALISKIILKPLIIRKAKEQIGGKVEISKDPLLWLIPVILVSVFFYLLYFKKIPTINLF